MAKTAAPKPVERGIAYWMERVVSECEKAKITFDADAVHDLRVALRRCRSMAEGFQSVNGDPNWKKMRKAGSHETRDDRGDGRQNRRCSR